jgi:PAS domain S-box-containing protein
MNEPLRVLIVEDIEDDALLVLRELERGGYDTTFKRVETAETMASALDMQSWDIVIADYHLPHFSAPEALEILHQTNLDLPFIVVSGAIAEGVAVATMKKGAHDYLMKDNLKRLVPTVRRELREAKIRKERRQTVIALEQSETKYKQLANSITDIFFAFDAELRYIYWNKASEELTGIPAKDALGKHLRDLFSDIEATRKAERLYIKALKTKQPQHFINEYKLKGNDYVFEISAYPSEGGLTVIAKDISEQRRVQEELRIAEQNFRNSLDSSPLGIRIVSIEGDLVYANQAILDIYGYSNIEELKSTPTKKRYTPNSYTAYLERQKKRKRGESTPVRYEVSIVRKDEEIRHLSVSRKAVVWNGEVQFQVVYQDITERKQAEEKITRVAEEWKTTFDSITDLISIQDRDYRLVRVNKAFANTLNMKQEELVGKTCYQVVHNTNKPVSNCPHMETMRTKKPATGAFFDTHLGLYLEVSTSPIFDEKGEIIASVHVARDISDRKKMEEKLLATDRLVSIGELASGIAHELNNPLTGVVGFSELLVGRKDIPDDAREDLETVNREAKRAAKVVKNLLIFARGHPQEKKSLEINKVIENVVQLRAYEMKINNIQVDSKLASDLPEVIGDEFQLQQVFLNIIINSEHFMIEAHRGGKLIIITKREGDMIKTSFSDDGPGIAPENLPHLFDPFFTTKEVGKGTGLGLSICHGIVAEHGGAIYAESEPGKGANFIVELPIGG